ncbi:prepilin-type N-terminal cleavage/methylation domain-containing protein [bacterium]|nr:MAG: prepilin-type N-terminal cleavage/methylation domain-containing protein [bacterium]
MKRAFTLIEALVVVAVILFLAAILFPIFARSRDNHKLSCMSPLKQIGLGVLQYVQDYDERLPPTRVGATVGWADLLQPYLKSTQIFQCPQGQAGPTAFTTDYFYNRRLARVTMDKLTGPALTVLGGDGDDNAPTWNSWAQLPADATTNSDSPCQRHLGMGNYLFADGHVKALSPTSVSSTLTSPTSRPTFAFR